jgi:hypothetical protein
MTDLSFIMTAFYFVISELRLTSSDESNTPRAVMNSTCDMTNLHGVTSVEHEIHQSAPNPELLILIVNSSHD